MDNQLMISTSNGPAVVAPVTLNYINNEEDRIRAQTSDPQLQIIRGWVKLGNVPPKNERGNLEPHLNKYITIFEQLILLPRDHTLEDQTLYRQEINCPKRGLDMAGY